MRFRVEYAPRSTGDLAKIRDYITKQSRSRETAERLVTRLLDACESLNTLPERFPQFLFAREWRMMPVRNYLVFFRTHEKAVRIGHIRHAARMPFRG